MRKTKGRNFEVGECSKKSSENEKYLQIERDALHDKLAHIFRIIGGFEGELKKILTFLDKFSKFD